jgi:uncharacterized protein
LKFTRDSTSAVTIRDVRPGRIRVGTETYTEDIRISSEDVAAQSLPADLGELREEHLMDVLAGGPEMLILGTGWTPALPPRDLVFSLARRGIGLETMDTPAACRTFNILVGEGRRPVALLKIGAAS